MFFFFFQAEDGIRDIGVTGVQTCALPISPKKPRNAAPRNTRKRLRKRMPSMKPARLVSDTNTNQNQSPNQQNQQIGRASCKGKSVERGGRSINKKKKKKRRQDKDKRRNKK